MREPFLAAALVAVAGMGLAALLSAPDPAARRASSPIQLSAAPAPVLVPAPRATSSPLAVGAQGSIWSTPAEFAPPD